MRSRLISIITVIFALVFASCERRPLEESTWNNVPIPISIDWSQAALNPDNDPEQDIYSASVWLFPKDGGEPLEFRLTNPRGGLIDVPVGKYDVIVMNNTIREYSYISFEGTDRFNTFCAKAVAETSNRYISKGSDELFIKAPEILAAWSITDLDITQQMLTDSKLKAGVEVAQLTNITPQRLVYSLNITVHVKMLSSARSATGIVRGMASGCYLATGEAIPPSAGQAFVLNSRKYYEGQTANGTVETQLMTFGRLSQIQSNEYTFQTDFILNDNKPFGPTLHNITERIINAIPQGGERKLYIIVGIGDDQEIELPSVSGGGMDVGLGDWEDEEDIPLEI